MTINAAPLDPTFVDRLDRQAAILDSQAEATQLSLRDLVAELRSLRAQLAALYPSYQGTVPTPGLPLEEIPHAESQVEAPTGGDLPAPGGPETTPQPAEQPSSQKRSARRRHPPA